MNISLEDQKVTVFPFTQQVDGEETIIANASHTSLLVLPTSALDILNWLAQNKTLKEAQDLYEKRYGEVPDIEDFLAPLESEGFISYQVDSQSITNTDVILPPTSHKALVSISTEKAAFFSFDWISQKFFSRPVVFSCIGICVLGCTLTAIDPAILPSPNVLVFKNNLTLMAISTFFFLFFTVFLHEMAHFMAARAVGVPAKLSIGTRLWYLVAQTDISSIWMIPRRQRYLPVLAGSLLDATTASLLLFLLFVFAHGWLIHSALAVLLCQIALFTYIFRLLWECFLFVRTDFYYCIAIFWNCKNLMSDTETFLKNQWARFFHPTWTVDQTAIPPREMKVIHYYALVWVAGRLLSFGSLIFFTIPILLGYYVEIGRFLLQGSRPQSIAPTDLIGWLILIIVPIVMETTGFVLWFRSFTRARRASNGRSKH